jgi:hypothetical protein
MAPITSTRAVRNPIADEMLRELRSRIDLITEDNFDEYIDNATQIVRIIHGESVTDNDATIMGCECIIAMIMEHNNY